MIGRKAGTLALATLAVFVVAACGGNTPAPSTSQNIGGSVTLWGEWTSSEGQAFKAALVPFTTQTGVTVNYAGKGSQMDTALASAIAGGAPPDVALVPDPGTVQTLATSGKIKDLTSILGSLSSNYGAAWNKLVTANGKLYGVWFKGSNKNTIWYNPAEFTAAGITSPPATWEDLIKDAGILKASGIAPFSLCTDIGWPMADFWQNVYLKTAGASAYNALATHATKWTDPTVTTAFNTFGQLVGQQSYLYGGLQGSLANSFPTCVDRVFPKAGAQPQAAMVFEGDFVATNIRA
ncbi:MAG TPA: ABC transporter substrate-binding protein, partial [Chloroflexota bacterium]|nr:ABC transporter substrate-binding protein [Chloroflexota bacterium]